MRLHSSIALAAVVAALAAPIAAEAKTRAPASEEAGLTAAEQLQMAQQQMAQMQAQLNALQARIDAMTGAGATPPPALAQAQSDAAAANAKADQALAAVTATQAAQTKTDKTLGTMKWAADTTVGGRVFFNFSNIDQQANGTKSAAHGTGFNIKRVYLSIDHKFNDVFSANITTDVSNVIGETSNGNYVTPTANTSTGSLSNLADVGRGFYVKNAYLQAKINPALVVRLGAAPLPWVPYIEGQYGYRHIENVLIDRVGYGTSADWGIHVGGDLAGKILNYQVSVVNGAGYRNIKVSKSVDVEGRIGAAYDNFWGAVGGYVGKRGANTEGATNVYHTAKRFDAALGYKTPLFGIGAEYFYAKDWNNVTTVAEESSNGYSVFGNVNFAKKWSAFGKYEWVSPNRMTVPSLRDHYFNVGLQYEPVKVVDLALVYKRDVADNGAITTQNGTIGAAGVGSRGTYDEVGIFGQFKF